MENLRSVGVFVRAVELGSFAAAAAVLGLTPSAVSKSISTLERALKVRLLVRSSRGIVTTDEGARFYARCRAIVSDLDEAEREVSQSRTLARGKLRVALHVTPARVRILPALPKFIDAHPEVELEVRIFPSARSVATEGIDVGVFFGDPSDADLIARRIADQQFVTCASQAYLARYGIPRHPEDLAGHKCLEYLTPEGRTPTWTFEKAGLVREHRARSRLKLNDGPALAELASAGAGIVHLMQMTVASQVATGALVPLLADWTSDAPPIHIVHTRGVAQAARVREFIEFVTLLFRDMPTTRSPARRWPMLRG